MKVCIRERETANSLPVSQLETLVPTFFVCNQEYHTNITKWVTCNAEYVADGTNKKIINRYLPLARQIEPLVMKANENLNAFSLVAEPLISEDNKEIISKLPSSVDPEAWKKSISTSLGLMKIIEANSKSVLNFLSYNKSAPSLAWEVLRNPSTLRLAYTDDHRKDFNNIVNLLNQSKNEIKKTMETLSEKFEEVEVPVFGKVPLGLTNAVIIYPAAVGLGCLICSYYLSQMITKRKTLQKECNVDVNKIRDLYPLWVDPLEEKTWIRYGKLVLFILLPYLILFVILSLLVSNPIKAGSLFGLDEGSILAASLLVGYILAAIGTIIVLGRSTKKIL